MQNMISVIDTLFQAPQPGFSHERTDNSHHGEFAEVLSSKVDEVHSSKAQKPKDAKADDCIKEKDKMEMSEDEVKNDDDEEIANDDHIRIVYQLNQLSSEKTKPVKDMNAYGVVGVNSKEKKKSFDSFNLRQAVTSDKGQHVNKRESINMAPANGSPTNKELSTKPDPLSAKSNQDPSRDVATLSFLNKLQQIKGNKKEHKVQEEFHNIRLPQKSNSSKNENPPLEDKGKQLVDYKADLSNTGLNSNIANNKREVSRNNYKNSDKSFAKVVQDMNPNTNSDSGNRVLNNGLAARPEVNTMHSSSWHVAQQIIQKTQTHIAQGKTFMEIQLKPEFLGRVKVHLTYNEGLITASLTADKNHAGNILNSAMQQIRNAMQEQGIKVEYLGVNVGGQEADGYQGNKNEGNSSGYNRMHNKNICTDETVAIIPQEISDDSQMTGVNYLA